MIFILEEAFMNGTVTMATLITGVEAESFDDAVIKVRKVPNLLSLEAEGKVAWYQKDGEVGYTIQGGDFPTVGRMTNKVLNMLE